MARFFFDMILDSMVVRAPQGVELADAIEALRGIVDAIEGVAFTGVERVIVRDEQGAEIASFDLHALRTGQVRGVA